jgi:hypothetical protein
MDTLPRFVAALDTSVVAFWREVHCRDRSVMLARAPAAYIAAAFSGSGDGHDRKRRAPDDDTRHEKGKKGPADGGRGDKIERAKRPLLRWKDSVPPGSRTPKELFETISKGIHIQPIFPSADLVRDSTKKKICFGFCLEGSSGGCKRKPTKPCPYAHIDGDSDAPNGPDSYGSLTKFLAIPKVAEKLEYTARGREFSSGN